MYDKYTNKNNIWETQHYGFPVAKSTTTDPDLERAVKIDQTIKDEETARINEDIRINARIDKEIKDRIAADENEASLRASADDALKEKDAAQDEEIAKLKITDNNLLNYIYDIFSIRYRKEFTFKSRTEFHPLWNYTASEKCIVMVYLSVGTTTAQNSVLAAIGIGDVQTDARSNILVSSQSISNTKGDRVIAEISFIATLNAGQHIKLYSSSILANQDISCLITSNVVNN